MRSIATLAASLLLVATPSLSFSLPPDDQSSIFTTASTTISSQPTNYHFDERSGILTEFLPSSPSSPSSLGGIPFEKRDTFTASYGLMLERDLAPDDTRASKFEKRKVGGGGGGAGGVRRKRARDSGPRELINVGFTKRGELVLPQSVLEKRAGRNKTKTKSQTQKKNKNKNKKKKSIKKGQHSKQAQRKKSTSPKMNKVVRSTRKKNHTKKQNNNNNKLTSSNGIQRSLVKLAASVPQISAFITWYTGVDLEKPYCADKSGWTPTDSSLISAVTLDWGKGRPACGSFLQLKSPSNNKSVIVRMVDMCGGCKPGVPHVDLSKAAFQALFSLDVGKVGDIQVSTLSGPPFKTWTPQLQALYGPENL